MNMVDAYPFLFSFPACRGVCFHILFEVRPTIVKVPANGLQAEGMRMVCRLKLLIIVARHSSVPFSCYGTFRERIRDA